MGASSSTERRPPAEQQEQESLAASTGSLNFLKSAFDNLSDPQSQSIPLSSLRQSLSLIPVNLAPSSPPSAPEFPLLLPHLGPAVAELFFAAGKNGADWTAFLRGFNRCCAPMPMPTSLNLVYRIFSDACRRAEIACRLEFDPDDADGMKVGGSFGASDLLMFLWYCWIMEQSPRLWTREADEELILPELSHMLISAFVACGEIGDDESVWEFDQLVVGKSLAVHKLNGWVLAMAFGLVSCFPQFLREKIKAIAFLRVNVKNSNISGGGGSSMDINDSFLLTHGRSWAISLTQRSILREELSAASIPGLLNHRNLLYRSSTHGKGLSRFWSKVEGYHGPLLFLFSGYSADSTNDERSKRNWVIGILTENGFENKDTYYGNSAHLYAISPIFRVLSPTGNEKNFLYSHLRPTGRVYEASPKPVGLAFGGVGGNERIFIEDDFSTVIIRHHVVDKTYQHGSLVPNQGYLPVEAKLVEAEAWGFGGSSAQNQQDAYKKREDLFTEQRRRVDLKNFSSWEDSPEKIMMDMVSDPNRVQRVDR
ncbi:hypothetical protein KSP39_PZI007971 [Platanthera zijinensis]|uniref:TLDc domain-containing protein n=1 Tax=Platanthera zijinensis TaxID=2320716 RepID=A0AAP0G8X8_9ASPA